MAVRRNGQSRFILRAREAEGVEVALVRKVANFLEGVPAAMADLNREAAAETDEELAAVAVELKARRRQLGLTQRQAAVRCGVHHTVLCEVEKGRRIPSLATFAKIRKGLGLERGAEVLYRPRRVEDVSEAQRRQLAASIVVCRQMSLADLADAALLSIDGVQQLLRELAQRIEAVGLELVVSDVEAMVRPQPVTIEALGRLEEVSMERELTPEALEVLAYLVYTDGCTRAELDYIRRTDCTGLLHRLSRRGLVSTDETGKAPVYSVTAKAIGMMGCASIGEARELLNNAFGGITPPPRPQMSRSPF